MRNDLTANFLVEMDKDENTPIQLMIFHFAGLGDVYLSDRDITVDGNQYRGIVEEWGDKSTVGAENAINSTETMTVTLWNGGSSPFSLKFQSEDPIDIFVDLYQTYDGLAAADMAHIGEFVVQAPIEYSEATSLLELELVTTNMRYFGQVGTLLIKQDDNNPLEADLNKPIDLIVGNAGTVKCLCSNKPASATLSGSFLLLPTTIYTHENLENFTQFGFIQIDDEIMRYTSRGDNHFNISARGQHKTIIIDHSDGAEIIQASNFNGIHPAIVEYVVGQGPISSITNVKIKGQTPAIPYDVLPGNNPATIQFTEQPTYIEYSKGARLREEFFDNINGSDTNVENTAAHPEWSYNQEKKSLGAIISKDNDLLSVIQKDESLDDGQIVKVFLVVEHWATKAYLNDQVKVFVDGVNNGVKIGELNRPNDKDIIEVGGEVDLRHGHLHANGVDHSHGNEATNVSLSDPSHPHGLTATYTKRATGTPFASDYTKTSGFGNHGHSMYFYNSGAEVIKQAVLTFSFEASGSYSSLKAKLYVRRKDGEWGFIETKILYPASSGTVTMITGAWSAYGSELEFKIVTEWNYSGAHVLKFTDPQVEYIVEETQTDTSSTGITSNTTTGSVTGLKQDHTVIKDPGDVEDLPEDTLAELKNILQDNASRSVTQKFDVTSYLEDVEWSWMQDRKVYLQYTGTNDDVEVVVTNLSFEVEYRQRQVKTTDEITCDVVGSIESRADAVVQYLLTEKAGLDASKLGSVNRNEPILYDTHVMLDSEVWVDEGQVGEVPDGALFEKAGAWFAPRNYYIDGVISGASTIKDAIQKITYQTHSRLTWQNGFAKLSVSRKNEDWLIAKDINTNDIQLRSYEVKRSESNAIINLINLFYKVDRLSEADGAGQYAATSFVEDPVSKLKHGTKTDDSKWLFDLVRRDDMADDIAEYYLWLLGETQTYYSLKTYLKHFNVEKEDYIKISSYNIDRLSGLPVAVKEIVRTFGSGKLSRINLLSLVCQSIRHRFYQKTEEENLLIIEDILATIGLSSKVEENIELIENIAITVGITPEDEEISISENYDTEMLYTPKIEENASVTEETSIGFSRIIEEEISISDDARGAVEIPFGGGGFGSVPFGSIAFYDETEVDTLSIEEEYRVGFGIVELEDISISEKTVTSGGFGGTTTLSSGFGVTPFGN